MIFYPISALINAITSTIVCIIALIRNPRSRLNRSFCYFAASVAFWSYFYFLWQISRDPTAALLWCRILMAGAIFIPSTFLHFSVTLIKQREKYLKAIKSCYIISTLFLILDFTPFFIKDVRPRLFFPYWPTAGISYLPFLLVFFGLTLYAHILMFKQYQKLNGFERNQIKYVFIGTAIGFLGGSTNYPLWFDVPVLPVGNVLVAVYVFLVAFAIIKYRLMDIDLAWRYGLSYCIYALVSIAIFIPLIFLLKDSLLGLILLGFFGFLVAPFIYSKLTKYLQPAILGTKYSYWDNLKDFWDKQREVYTSSQLFDVLEEIPAVMGIKSYSFFMFDRSRNVFVPLAYAGLDGVFDPSQAQVLNTIYSDDSLPVYLAKERRIIIRDDLTSRTDTAHQPLIDQMNSIMAQLSVPLFVTGKLTAILNLGPRQNQEMYHEQDMERLREITRIAEKHLSHISFFESSIFFSGSVAHDIRKPFRQGIINNFLNDIAKEPLSVAQKQALDNLKHLLGNIYSMSEDMVSAFKNLELFLKTGFKPQKIDYAKLINEESKPFEILAGQKGITLEISLPKKELFLQADPLSVKRILNELLSNAFKYTDKGCIKIKVSQYQENNHKEIITEVTDTGCGIAEENRNEIWELFKRGKSVQAKEGEGIGLAMVRQLAEANGGKISLNSSKGNGSNFILRLPAWEDKNTRR